jgi:hypothetical protein
MTQVRYNPATTENRRDTVEGLNRRVSCIHRDEQLQLRAARSQRVQAVFGAPGKEAAQVRLAVLTRGALEPGLVGSHRQPQLISERHQTIGRDGRQLGESHHAQTLRSLPAAAKPAKRTRRGRSTWEDSEGTFRVDTPARTLFMRWIEAKPATALADTVLHETWHPSGARTLSFELYWKGAESKTLDFANGDFRGSLNSLIANTLEQVYEFILAVLQRHAARNQNHA